MSTCECVATLIYAHRLTNFNVFINLLSVEVLINAKKANLHFYEFLRTVNKAELTKLDCQAYCFFSEI